MEVEAKIVEVGSVLVDTLVVQVEAVLEPVVFLFGSGSGGG